MRKTPNIFERKRITCRMETFPPDQKLVIAPIVFLPPRALEVCNPNFDLQTPNLSLNFAVYSTCRIMIYGVYTV